ncbi:MAG: hypothetical protein ACREM6_14665, partial [Vulcanimicrobiaceae bacterium]
YDPTAGAHFLNVTFAVEADGEPQLPTDDAHVIDLAWVARAEVPDRIAVRVVREPLAAALDGDTRRYFGFADAAITIEFADEA